MKMIQKILGVLLAVILLMCLVIGLYALVPGFASAVNGIMGRPGENAPADAAPAPANAAGGSAGSLQPWEESVPAEGSGTAGGEASAEPLLPTETVPAEAYPTETFPTDLNPAEPTEEAPQIDLTVPDVLARRTGGQEILPEDLVVSDAEAERIEATLPTGPTGDELDFDPLFYPYYAMLDAKEAALYLQIYANAGEYNAAFRAVDQSLSKEQIKNAFSALFYDHPELFWLETAYQARYRNNGDFLELDLVFNRTAQEADAAKARFAQAAEQFVQAAENYASDHDREKYVHDALAEHNRYSLGAEMNQSAYSSIVGDATVCAGYARGFQYLMQQLGVPCYFCAGYAGESHAWNIIYLGGEYYNVDVTWDDTDNAEVCNHKYFNRTDADLAKDHARRGLSVYLPPCNGTVYAGAEEAESELLPDIGDYDISENEILHDLQGYYDDCYAQLTTNGYGNYSFRNVIEGEELYRQWYRAYTGREAQQQIMQPALDALGGGNLQMNVTVTPLFGRRYLLEHAVQLSGR
ncbi:MAG: hypothetical protein IJ600_00465 [Lachnospiraceae bacterium]|nr:hypothetical protein [Lachnospiraceae bacterium]